MKTKSRAKPEKREPEKREPEKKPRAHKPVERAKAPKRPQNARAVAPKPARAVAPKPAQGRTLATQRQAQQLADAPEADEYEPESMEVPYPLFPRLPRGLIHSVRVYRKVPRPHATGNEAKGMEWVLISFPWDPAMLTWDMISQVCGGGSFAIVARNERQQTIGSVQRTIEGEPRAPTMRDAMRFAPGVSEPSGAPITETPNGWLALPNVDPGTQAAFLAFQQVAFYARDDAQRAIGAMALLTEKLAERALQPDPGLAVLETQVDLQRNTIEKLYKELADLRSQNTNLRITEAQAEKKSASLKTQMTQKALDIVDNVAGVVASRMLPSMAGEAASAAAAPVAPVAPTEPNELAQRLAQGAGNASG